MQSPENHHAQQNQQALNMKFPVQYQAILAKIDEIHPVSYGKTRNFINGAVTRLSPYISRGVISLPMIKDVVLKKFNRHESEKLLQELAWREYWQRVWECKSDDIFSDLKQPQKDIATHQIPSAIVNATTGIHAVDNSIRSLYETGYMHNHCRMYVASIACNIGKAHWLQPSRWLYYHLLDGDLASNSLSWQWVAGSFSSKKYFCNQENINKYCFTDQHNTFLDKNYDELPLMARPDILCSTENLTLTSELPVTPAPTINKQYPTLIYNPYNLDPLWYKGVKANRILLLEPAHFQKFPVSRQVMDFIVALAANIDEIQIYTGNFEQLSGMTGNSTLVFKQHPAFPHYDGQAVTNEYLFPWVSGYFPSFFAYWKKCEKFL
jgi:deoxyribodipyrimidine photo-lyase